MIQEYQGSVNTKVLSYDKGDLEEDATVYLYGKENGKWERKKSSSNDGIFVVAYPENFSGESELQVRDEDDNVLDEGTILVGAEND